MVVIPYLLLVWTTAHGAVTVNQTEYPNRIACLSAEKAIYELYRNDTKKIKQVKTACVTKYIID
jgi:hypothetical protein